MVIFFAASPSFANMIMGRYERSIKAYYTQNAVRGLDTVLVGKVISFSSRNLNKKKGLLNRAEAKSKTTVRLYNKEGLAKGQTLFLIDRKNIIVARLKVGFIFKSRSFGFLLIGYGNFRLASVGNRVVQKVEYQHSKYAFIHKARGDYFKNTGKYGAAIKEYKRAIQLDKGIPGAHLELGYIYIKQKLPHYAMREFQEGYKYINRLYDNEDKFRLLRGLAMMRYNEVFYTQLHPALRKKYQKEGLLYCRRALKFDPGSVKINFYIGMFYYRGSRSLRSDVKAKNYFLKVIKVNPDHVKANVALSVLYLKHKNKKKAQMFAYNALRVDPANTRAKKIIYYIKKYYKNK